MSQTIRQSNLFAAEDFIKIFSTFKDVDFTAYDYNSIREALVNYIRIQYPEDFNDYIESSEFIAIIELLSYLGTSLAFRTELNSRENFLDTAERRESILRLARMLSYAPKRNQAAKGLFKLVGVRTDQPVFDSAGRSLQSTTIFWNDANNPDGFEQFTTVLNAAFTKNNPYGRPYISAPNSIVPSDLYILNNSGLGANTYQVSIPLVDGAISVDIVNPVFDSFGNIQERHINGDNAWHVIYKNDGNGFESPDSGFFMHFRQGDLRFRDFLIEEPEENLILDIDDININETDVYVQEIDDQGAVLAEWTKVPSVVGSNVYFNDVDLEVRKIYSVLTTPNDGIRIKFADGKFGEMPTGYIRVWFRKSANRFLTIRPENAANIQISIPYAGENGRNYQLTMLLALQNTVSNSAPSETNEDIQQRAPQVFYTQNRMVNAEDYNVFPLSKGNEIEKIKATNRTHAGHSRFIDINDPTGKTQSLIVFGEDGAIYRDFEQETFTFEVNSTTQVNNNGAIRDDLEKILREDVQTFLKNQRLNNFFYSVVVDQFKSTQLGAEINFIARGENLRWRPAPFTPSSDVGFFIKTAHILNPGDFDAIYSDGFQSLDFSPYDQLRPGAYLRFKDPNSDAPFITTSIKRVVNQGVPVSLDYTRDGPVTLSDDIPAHYVVADMLPSFDKELSNSLIAELVSLLAIQSDFGLGFSIEDQEWFLIPYGNLDITGDYVYRDRNFSGRRSDWLVIFNYVPPSGTQGLGKYQITTRGTRYLFSSEKEVRFFFSPDQKTIDVQTGQVKLDEITLSKLNSGARLADRFVLSGTPIDGVTITRASRHRLATINSATGEPLPTFNPSFNGRVNDAVVQQDGNIVVSGAFTTANGQVRNRLARLTPQGVLDSGFNPSFNDVTVCVVQQTDGKLLVSGQFTQVNGANRPNVVRLLPDGTIDTTFSYAATENVSKIFQVSNGNIVLQDQFSIVFVNSVGSVIQTHQILNGATIWAIAQRNSEILVVAPYYGSKNPPYPSFSNEARARIIRFDLNGQFLGVIDTPFTNAAYDLIVEPDGKLMVVGANTINTAFAPTNAIYRFNSNGTLDTTFNAALTGTLSSILSVVRVSDGYVLTGNFVGINGQPKTNIAKIDFSGNLVTSFTAALNVAGHVVTTLPGGDLLLGGDFTQVSYERVNSDFADWVWIDSESGLAYEFLDYQIPLRERTDNENNTDIMYSRGTTALTNFDGLVVYRAGSLRLPTWSTSLPGFNYQVGDVLTISYDSRKILDNDLQFNIYRSFIMPDGHLDQTTVEIKPVDVDQDGVPDFPRSFYDFVNVTSDSIIFEQYQDFDGYEYTRPLKGGYVDFVDTFDIESQTIESYGIDLIDVISFDSMGELIEFVAELEVCNGCSSSQILKHLEFCTKLEGKLAFIKDTQQIYVFPRVKLAPNTVLPQMNISREYLVLREGETNISYFVESTKHFYKVGRSFNLNTLTMKEALYFKWKHYAPKNNRLDPSPSNIVDMFILTKQYNRRVQSWKTDKLSLDMFPEPSTSQELKQQFGDLLENKMISDEIIFRPAKYKVLFGENADEKLRAKFKAVKIPGTAVSDNEVKSRIVAAIEEYFDINNWTFGESFYFTELSAYIHQRLAGIISTVVIVPETDEQQFGDLFQIKAETDELFLSTATVLDIDIVSSLTDTNLRTK